MAEGKHFKV